MQSQTTPFSAQRITEVQESGCIPHGREFYSLTQFSPWNEVANTYSLFSPSLSNPFFSSFITQEIIPTIPVIYCYIANDTKFCGLKQQQSFMLLMHRQLCQGLVGQLLFAPHCQLGQLNWGPRIHLQDGAFRARCWCWGSPGAFSWGTQFSSSGPLHVAPWTFSEQDGRVPRMFQKVQRESQGSLGHHRSPESHCQLQHLLGLGNLRLSLLYHYPLPPPPLYGRLACTVSNFTVKEQWQTFRTPWN